MVSAMPGYWTLTATARPSRVTARCTCPIEAAAIGRGSQRANARSGGTPSSSSTTAAASCGLIGGTLSWRRARVLADRGRQAVVDVAGHLADLHHDALHRPQGAGDVFGGLQGQVLAQQLALLARGREQPRRAGRVAGPAARGQPERRPGAIKAQPPGPAAQQDQGRGARHRRGEEPDELHAGRAARIRRVIRCRASSTPG